MYILHFNFSDPFVKLRKGTINVVISVHLSFRMKQLGSQWKEFHAIWCLWNFQRSVEKIEVSPNETRIKSPLHEDQYTFFIISRSFLLRIKNISNKRCREKQNTHFYSVIVFRKLYLFWEKAEKFCLAGQATDDNMAHARCMLGT